MILKTIAIHVLGTALMTSGMGVTGFAQKAKTRGKVPTSSATQVSAEMTKGRLNPNESKPGDRVAMKLRETVRSNGRIVLKSQTASSLESTFGMSSSAQLYRAGRGGVVSAGGTKHSMDIFSHMSNDTVITSSSTSFEISSGAELQVLVGVKG